MSVIKVSGNTGGTGIFHLRAPNSSTDRFVTLPDVTGNFVTTGDSGTVDNAMISDGTIQAAKLSGGQSGSAPAFTVRAWVAFNGTGTVAIRGSGNVSSISEVGTGAYNVNFTTGFSDGNYAISVVGSKTTGSISSTNSTLGCTREYLGNGGYVQVYTITSAGAAVDRNYTSVLVIR